MRTANIRFYTTAGCHLCDKALALVLEVGQRIPLAIEEIDIAESDPLIEKYGLRIPVLVRDADQRELGWPFNAEALIGFLAD